MRTKNKLYLVTGFFKDKNKQKETRGITKAFSETEAINNFLGQSIGISFYKIETFVIESDIFWLEEKETEKKEEKVKLKLITTTHNITQSNRGFVIEYLKHKFKIDLLSASKIVIQGKEFELEFEQYEQLDKYLIENPSIRIKIEIIN